MIELYRRSVSPLADEIEEDLRDMVAAYRTIVVEGRAGSSPVAEAELPALRDGADVVTGEDALRRHLASLRRLLEDWGRFQSDACHTDRDGRVC